MTRKIHLNVTSTVANLIRYACQSHITLPNCITKKEWNLNDNYHFLFSYAESETVTSSTLVKVSDTKPISQADFLKQLMSAFSESAPHYSASASVKTDKVGSGPFFCPVQDL